MANEDENELPFEVDLDELTFKEIDTIESLADGQSIGSFMNPKAPQGKIVPAMAYVCTLRLGTGESWGDLFGMKFNELSQIIAKVFPKGGNTQKKKTPQDHQKKTPKPAKTKVTEQALPSTETNEESF